MTANDLKGMWEVHKNFRYSALISQSIQIKDKQYLNAQDEHFSREEVKRRIGAAKALIAHAYAFVKS